MSREQNKGCNEIIVNHPGDTMLERTRVVTLNYEGKPQKFIEKYYLPLA